MEEKKKVYKYDESDYFGYHENSGFFECPECDNSHWVRMPDDGDITEFSCTCGAEGEIRWSIPDERYG